MGARTCAESPAGNAGRAEHPAANAGRAENPERTSARSAENPAANAGRAENPAANAGRAENPAANASQGAVVAKNAGKKRGGRKLRGSVFPSSDRVRRLFVRPSVFPSSDRSGGRRLTWDEYDQCRTRCMAGKPRMFNTWTTWSRVCDGQCDYLIKRKPSFDHMEDEDDFEDESVVY